MDEVAFHEEISKSLVGVRPLKGLNPPGDPAHKGPAAHGPIPPAKIL